MELLPLITAAHIIRNHTRTQRIETHIIPFDCPCCWRRREERSRPTAHIKPSAFRLPPWLVGFRAVMGSVVCLIESWTKALPAPAFPVRRMFSSLGGLREMLVAKSNIMLSPLGAVSDVYISGTMQLCRKLQLKEYTEIFSDLCISVCNLKRNCGQIILTAYQGR
jgi:hypothetical protein